MRINTNDNYLAALIAATLAVMQLSYTVAADFEDPTSVGWKFHSNLTGAGYSNVWNQYRDDGYLPIDIETDVVSGNTRYAGRVAEEHRWAGLGQLAQPH